MRSEDAQPGRTSRMHDEDDLQGQRVDALFRGERLNRRSPTGERERLKQHPRGGAPDPL